jgi:hypothetical protein
MFETLLLANPDTNTLRPVRSRASTSALRTGTASRVFAAAVLRGLVLGLHCYFSGLDLTHSAALYLGGLAKWFGVRTNLVVGSRG